MNAIVLDTLPSPAADQHVVRRLLTWMREQPIEGRVRAVSALARAYIASSLPEALRSDALMVMTTVLDDVAPPVRRALAEALASAADAPRHIVMALAADRAEVARPVLAHSALLDDAALAEAAALGECSLQIVIAQRRGVSGRALWTLADCGQRAAVVALIGNPGAALEARAMGRIFERFRDDADIRARLAHRGGLPPSLRIDLALANVEDVTDLGVSRDWLGSGRAERLTRDAREQAVVRIARGCQAGELLELVEHVRERGFLNVALLMRSLLSGDLSLFETALGCMSGAPAARVAGFMAQWRGRGFAALYEKAALPQAFLPAFRAALEALSQGVAPHGEGVCSTLALRAIEDCERLADPALAPVLSLMWRLAGEGARAEARELIEETAVPEAPPSGVAPLTAQVHAAPTLQWLAFESVADAGGAPRLDFAPHLQTDGADFAPLLPARLAFDSVNENFAPLVDLDLEIDPDFQFDLEAIQRSDAAA